MFRVAQTNPDASTPADLFAADAGEEAVVSTLAVAEHGGAPALYRVLVRPAGAAASTEHRLVWDAALDANETAFFTIGISLAPTDVITVESSTADVTFTAFLNVRMLA